MKLCMRIAAVLIVLCMNTCIAESSVTLENLIDDWSEKYTNHTEGDSMVAYTYEADACISKHEALSTAVSSIVLLALESPTSLSERFCIQFDLYCNDEEDRLAWDVQFYDRNSHSYTIRVDAITGELCAIYVFNSATMPDSFFEDAPHLDEIIDEWYILYSESPSFSPAVYAAELEDPMFPNDAGVYQREALRCVLQVLMKLEGEDADMSAYIPYVEYNVSPAANRWHIMLDQPEKCITFVIDAETGVVERMKWNRRSDK